MSQAKMRRQILCEAARLVVRQEEVDYHRAKLRAARQVCAGPIDLAALPTHRELINEVELLIRGFEATGDPGVRNEHVEPSTDRFRVYASLLFPLEQVKQSPKRHPEGDALYHSLQVFQLAQQQLPYDEEFLLAALLHDVGKAIDPNDHVAAGLDALNGSITQRTAWLIEHHGDAHALRDGTLGARSRRRLGAHEDYDELMLLAQCDRQGRRQGVQVPDIEEALHYVRELSASCDSQP